MGASHNLKVRVYKTSCHDWNAETLKMEATISSERFVIIHQTWRHNPNDATMLYVCVYVFSF